MARANGSVASRVDIGHSILNGSRPVFADLARLSLPLSPLTLLSARLSRPGRILSDHYLPSSVWDLVRHVHEKTLKFECQILKDEPENVTAIIPQEGNLKYMPSTIPEDEPLSFGKLEGDDHFHAACRCAANIHLKSLGQLVPFSSNGNQKLVRQLEFSLSSLSNGMWLETETEIYIWLCFTGVAAAQAGKAWFLAKVAPTVLSLKPEEFGQVISRILRFWRLILYLKGLDV